jgi:glycine/D-amino acid oxidase-like deaminating enzyme/nitrite reductase/ring-hydroxylating ferredoxin subunit
MKTTSVWQASAPEASFPALSGDVRVDTVIVGGGITGATLALLLSAEGQHVALVEARRLGYGATGNSTGNLYEVVSERLHAVKEKWGKDTAQAVAHARRDTISFLEEIVNRFALDCDLVRRPLYLYAASNDERDSIDAEYEALAGVGATARVEETPPLSHATGPVLILENQAQFHALRYVDGVAQAIHSERCRVFENTVVTDIDAEHHCVHAAGGTLHARNIVLATHTPKGRYIVHAEMEVHREYGIACKLASGTYPVGIFWGEGAHGHSVRSVTLAGEQYLLVIGKDCRTGTHDALDASRSLEDSARSHFDIASIDFRWSAQNYRSPDLLPYIGQSTGSEVYIATGFATDGLTWGPLAARIIADAICGRANRWADLFDASRLTPLKSAKGIASENVGVAKALIKGYLTDREKEALESVAPGSAAIVDIEGERFAAYRDESGKLSVVSPVCTHMKCVVQWNGFERTWDCPCHGSRFGIDGSVIEGPALAGLTPQHISQHS